MAKTRITPNSNGSLRIEGDFEIVDKDGNKGHFEHEAIAFDLPPKK
jgi:hypothetical protein